MKRSLFHPRVIMEAQNAGGIAARCSVYDTVPGVPAPPAIFCEPVRFKTGNPEQGIDYDYDYDYDYDN